MMLLLLLSLSSNLILDDIKVAQVVIVAQVVVKHVNNYLLWFINCSIIIQELKHTHSRRWITTAI